VPSVGDHDGQINIHVGLEGAADHGQPLGPLGVAVLSSFAAPTGTGTQQLVVGAEQPDEVYGKHADEPARRTPLVIHVDHHAFVVPVEFHG